VSRRFIALALVAYGGIFLSVTALILLILGFGRVGQCSSVDNTWDACMERTDILATLIFSPPIVSILAAIIALAIRREPGEKGRWAAASALFVAPLLLAVLLWGAMNLGIK
jgi:hypothetical protein